MDTVLRIINERASQIVALGGAAINVAFVFGAPLDEAQILALNGLLFTLVAVLTGREIVVARRQQPPPE